MPGISNCIKLCLFICQQKDRFIDLFPVSSQRGIQMICSIELLTIWCSVMKEKSLKRVKLHNRQVMWIGFATLFGCALLFHRLNRIFYSITLNWFEDDHDTSKQTLKGHFILSWGISSFFYSLLILLLLETIFLKMIPPKKNGTSAAPFHNKRRFYGYCDAMPLIEEKYLCNILKIQREQSFDLLFIANQWNSKRRNERRSSMKCGGTCSNDRFFAPLTSP